MNATTRKKFLIVLTKLLKQLKNLTTAAYYQAVEALRDNIAAGMPFSWNENPTVERQINKFLDILEGKINILIANGVSEFYKQGLQDAADEVAKALKGKGVISRPRNVRRLKVNTTEGRRQQAAAGYQQTVSYRGGALNNLSNRVWDFKTAAKTEIATIVNKAIENGQSVLAVRDDIRQYLNTNKSGAMAKPGRGVYRSLEKNCERLMRTEMQAAYRSAEIDSYQGDDAVLGYRIRLSGNHTSKDSETGKITHLNDICDKCAGIYPKTFYWYGWHPNCRCYITPITLTPEQFADYMAAEDEGKTAEFMQKISITEYPQSFVDYVRNNGDKLKNLSWYKANAAAISNL